jgi:uracil-DNA glycosylase family protein
VPSRRPTRRPPFEAESAERPLTAEPFVPASRSLPVLRKAAAGCEGCGLYLRATQVVFGQGPRRARVMLVGEQPGDKEDLAGEPFVGPAGGLLRRALADAGLDPDHAYVTNAVKHFSWEPRGKRRIHKKPRASEVRACRPWLEAEIDAVRPAVIVALGATAAQSLLGAGFKLTAARGRALSSPLAQAIVATVHPSAILRAPDDEARHAAYDAFVTDLKEVARLLGEGGKGTADENRGR